MQSIKEGYVQRNDLRHKVIMKVYVTNLDKSFSIWMSQRCLFDDTSVTDIVNCKLKIDVTSLPRQILETSLSSERDDADYILAFLLFET